MHHTWIRFIVALLIASFCGVPAVAVQKKSPNIVVILADDLGWGDLSCQGAKDVRTPHIDALFRAGMRFNSFYANSCVCSPTRAALLSGRYPELVGIPGVVRTHDGNNWGHLTRDAVLLPDVLKRAGYHTAIVGKWHLGLTGGNTPTERGFDFFHGFLGDMMDDYYHHRRHNVHYMRKNKTTIHPQGHATDLFTKWAGDYVRDRAKKKQPFFLYLAYNAPHSPIQPPKDWLAKVKQREKNINERRAKLVALIEHMDHGIGQVVSALKDSGVYDNTLILFVSDNGGALHFGANNGPLRDGKGSMYEGGLRVPMCAVWTGRIKAGSRCNAEGLTMDVFTTACDAAGAKIKHQVEGVSLLPLMLGKKDSLPPRDTFFIRREGGRRYMGKTIHAMHSGDWRLVQNTPGAEIEMYNLKNDPMEKTNLSKKQPQMYQKLVARMKAHIAAGEKVAWRRPKGQQALFGMNGTWRLIKSELAGKPLPLALFKDFRLTMKDGNYIVNGGPQVDKGTYKVSFKKGPIAVDILSKEGPNKGKTMRGIVAFDGKQLHVAYDLSGKSRPKTFTTKAGTELLYAVYVRVEGKKTIEEKRKSNDQRGSRSVPCFRGVPVHRLQTILSCRESMRTQLRRHAFAAMQDDLKIEMCFAAKAWHTSATEAGETLLSFAPRKNVLSRSERRQSNKDLSRSERRRSAPARRTIEGRDALIAKAITKVLTIQANAWNKGDVNAYMAHYWKSEKLTFSSGGKTTRGWKQTMARYKKRYPDLKAMGSLSFSKLEITPLGDDAALVLGRWKLDRKKDALGGNFSLVFRRIGGRWVIIHDHTSRTPPKK